MKQYYLYALTITTLGITQIANAQSYKKWTPSVTSSTAHDSSTNRVAFGNDPSGSWTNDALSKFNLGPDGHAYCGPLTPSDGFALYMISGAKKSPGFYKKVEVSAVVISDVKYGDAFTWYQSKNGYVKINGQTQFDTNSYSTTGDGWIGDSNVDPNSPSNSTAPYPVCTHNVHSDRALYLYDYPGISASNGISNSANQTISFHMSFRDRIYYKTTDSSGTSVYKDVDRVTTNSPWLPPTSWARNLEAQLPAGATIWTASQNN